MRRSRFTLIALFALVSVAMLPAQVFRIGSAAPENSPWGRTLNRLAAEWTEMSNGRVRVQVFHNSIAGIEADMVRKMRIGQLQAVVLSSTGLSNFSESLLTLSMPLLIRTQEEFDYVFPRVEQQLREQIQEYGFRVMGWSTAGWLYFFSNNEIRVPDDLRRAKLAASPEEMDLVRAYQLMGFQPVPVPYTERLASLVSGLANSYLTVPILAAGFQWFGATPNMLNLRVGPAPGAILMSDRAYQRLPADMRDEMMERAAEIAGSLNTDILELEQTAIDTMVEFGLTIHEPTAVEREIWIDELQGSYDVTLGLVFDEDFFRDVQGMLDEFRSR